jgi:hypothetical protein
LTGGPAPLTVIASNLSFRSQVLTMFVNVKRLLDLEQTIFFSTERLNTEGQLRPPLGSLQRRTLGNGGDGGGDPRPERVVIFFVFNCPFFGLVLFLTLAFLWVIGWGS